MLEELKIQITEVCTQMGRDVLQKDDHGGCAV
jgi:hypothetical protein